MVQIITISLENEMDLILAHRRSMKVAEMLGLTVATQTTFATAVSEVSRTVIEHTNNGNLEISLDEKNGRFSLIAFVTFDNQIRFNHEDDGFYYAQKLVPEFRMWETDGLSNIEMKLGVPRSTRLDQKKLHMLKEYFQNEEPLNAYEEIKRRNLTLNKIAEEQEEELRRSKIVDEKKNEFISIASHEIKTPITIIKAYTQLVLASKEQCSDAVKSHLTKIDYQTGKLLSLVNQLLDVSKIENGNLLYSLEIMGLNLFIQEMVSVMKHIIPEHSVILNLSDDAMVRIDKLRMEQVFSNLLGNAAKYSKINTVIRIDCECEHDGFVKIAISDQGIGISQNSIRSIFNKFFRVKDVLRSHSGLGMGLYIASKIVIDHGGKIWVESEKGLGSTFFFTIPVEKTSVRERVEELLPTNLD